MAAQYPIEDSAVEKGISQMDPELFFLSTEWKEARQSIDRFDKITVDLRKYGFSFIALIISSSSIIFDAAKVANPLPLVIVPIVIALLTLSLFLADSYYQVLLLAAILYTRSLENIHKELLLKNAAGQMYHGLNITNYIEDKVQKTRAHFYTVVVYILFLIISSLLGYFSLWAYELNTHVAHIGRFVWGLTAGFVIIVAFLVVISGGVWKLLSEMRKTEIVEGTFIIEKLFEKREVEKAISDVADKIYHFYGKTSFKILSMGIGGLYFANQLISELKKHRQLTNVELISAFSERDANNVVTIVRPEKSDISGENILIVDDLVSTGFTMLKAIEICKSLKAKTVRTCVLLDAHRKRHASASKLRIDFPGLRTDESKGFFVGSGLDGGEKMSPDAKDKVRLLPYIGILVAPREDSPMR